MQCVLTNRHMCTGAHGRRLGGQALEAKTAALNAVGSKKVSKFEKKKLEEQRKALAGGLFNKAAGTGATKTVWNEELEKEEAEKAAAAAAWAKVAGRKAPAAKTNDEEVGAMVARGCAQLWHCAADCTCTPQPKHAPPNPQETLAQLPTRTHISLGSGHPTMAAHTLRQGWCSLRRSRHAVSLADSGPRTRHRRSA